LTFWRQGWILDPFIFIFYFVRLPLCNKYSDYCDIYLYTLYYYICCLLCRMYEIHPALSIKTGCDMPLRWDLMEEEDSSLCLLPESLERVFPELAGLSPVVISLLA
jgi:hypothetical protein